jgi:predicted amidophosphoribosyltransferase
MVHQKGEEPLFHPNMWAELLLQRQIFPQLETLRLAGAEIVCPPSKTGRPDHAYRMAKLLAEKLDLEFVPEALKLVERQRSGISQKDLDRVGREQIRYEAPEKNSLSDNIVFVDDILTTGSTARAAYIALGKPSRFRVFVWAYRPLIAVKPQK